MGSNKLSIIDEVKEYSKYIVEVKSSDENNVIDNGNVGINSLTPEWELELHPNKDNGRAGLLIKADTENSYVTFTYSVRCTLNLLLLFLQFVFVSFYYW